jgi:hypothetical protein
MKCHGEVPLHVSHVVGPLLPRPVVRMASPTSLSWPLLPRARNVPRRRSAARATWRAHDEPGREHARQLLPSPLHADTGRRGLEGTPVISSWVMRFTVSQEVDGRQVLENYCSHTCRGWGCLSAGIMRANSMPPKEEPRRRMRGHVTGCRPGALDRGLLCSGPARRAAGWLACRLTAGERVPRAHACQCESVHAMPLSV